MKKLLFIFNKFIPIFLLMSLFAIFVDTVKYDGFIANHFYIRHINIFTFAVFLNMLTIIPVIKKYWWQDRLGRLVRVQSFVMTPFVLLFYTWSVLQEGLNYPNYIFSVYHVSLVPLSYFLYLEILILLMPVLHSNLREYLKELLEDS